MRVFAICLIVALSGCTTDYYKQGTTQQDLDADKAACRAASYQSAPPVMSTPPFGGGYNKPVNINCLGGLSSVGCTGGGYIPPPAIPVDTNGGTRVALFDTCMIDKGWSKTKPTDGHANTPAASTASAGQ